MNLNRVKNIFIISLIILNLVLFYFNIVNKIKSQMSNEEIENITNILNKNNITLSLDMNKDYFPLSAILLTNNGNELEIMKLFLGDKVMDFSLTTDDLGKNIYEYKNKSFTIDKNSIFYYNSVNKELDDFNIDNSIKQIEPFINLDNKELVDFNIDNSIKLIEPIINSTALKGYSLVLDRSYITEDEHIFEYRTKFKEDLIYSSYIRFKINGYGSQIKGRLTQPIEYIDNKKTIFAPNEALYAFLIEWKNLYGKNSEPAEITYMDIVYKDDEKTILNADSTIANPFYRIYISGRNEPFLINAY